MVQTNQETEWELPFLRSQPASQKQPASGMWIVRNFQTTQSHWLFWGGLLNRTYYKGPVRGGVVLGGGPLTNNGSFVIGFWNSKNQEELTGSLSFCFSCFSSCCCCCCCCCCCWSLDFRWLSIQVFGAPPFPASCIFQPDTDSTQTTRWFVTASDKGFLFFFLEGNAWLHINSCGMLWQLDEAWCSWRHQWGRALFWPFRVCATTQMFQTFLVGPEVFQCVPASVQDEAFRKTDCHQKCYHGRGSFHANKQ